MPEYDIALELARLHILSGAGFVRQLKMLTSLNIFKPVENEKDIFAAEGNHRDDFPMLLDAARKAYEDGEKKLQPQGQSILQTCGKLQKLGARQSAKNPLPQLVDIDEIGTEADAASVGAEYVE